MSYGFGFGTALRGLNAARLSMEIIGQNVSNVNTPGYTRQRVLLGSTLPTQHGANPFFIGTGVQVDNVHRILDARLASRIRAQKSLTGFAEVEYRRATEIEGIVGEPGDGALSGLFNAWFDSVSKLRGDASSRSLRGNVVQSAQELTSGFNLLAKRFSTLDGDSTLEVGGLVEDVNELSREIALLNRDIVALEVGSHQVNDLRDRRDRAIETLSELIDTNAITKKNGAVDVLVGGYLLVSGNRSTDLRASGDGEGGTALTIGNTNSKIRPTGGKIAALLQGGDRGLGELRSRLDNLARNFALEVNRIHATGMPKSGPFTSLLSENAVIDANGNGEFADEILAFAGLPFDVQSGDLFVSVNETATGNIERHRIAIDPNSMTLGEFAGAISEIPNLSANVDPTGRLRIQSSDGFGFDFSRRLDAKPNSSGTMGGVSATLGSNTLGPYSMTMPASFQVEVDGGGAQTINLTSADFKSITDISSRELATVLNEKFAASSVSAKAIAVGDSISIQAGSSGTTSSLRLTDGTGSPLATTGLPTGVTAQGQSNGIQVSVSGAYTGQENNIYRFVAEGDGQIGVTPGLTVGVYDQNGTKISSISVGKGYAPLDRIEIADGVQVEIGPGNISATNGDSFALDVLNNPDTSDILSTSASTPCSRARPPKTSASPTVSSRTPTSSQQVSRSPARPPRRVTRATSASSKRCAIRTSPRSTEIRSKASGARSLATSASARAPQRTCSRARPRSRTRSKTSANRRRASTSTRRWSTSNASNRPTRPRRAT